MWIATLVNGDVESYLCFDKLTPGARFSQDDAGRAGHLLRGLASFQRQLIPRGLLAAERPLTPTERRVLQLLLSPLVEKEIADQLGLSIGTTHDHVLQIYRKFGVRSRPALMALWLGRRARRSETRPAQQTTC